MKSERIAVRETSPLSTLLLLPLVAAASLLAVFALLGRLQPTDPSTILLVFVGIGVAPSAIVSWLLSLGRRATATPLLHVEGTGSVEGDVALGAEANRARLLDAFRQGPSVGALQEGAGVMLPSPSEDPICVKFTVCEEGIVLYRTGRADLVRWRRIRDLKANDESRQFELTIKTMVGRDSFSAPDRFDEVKRMLSEHIVVR
jgi:hypothetical protein